jgi:hypothetical protein
VRNFLRENPTLAGEIEAAVRTKGAGQAVPLRTAQAVRTGGSEDE